MARKEGKPLVRQRTGCAKRRTCAPLWLAECTTDMPRAMLCGGGYLAVENCGQVLRFDEKCVCVETKIGRLTVEGCALSISRENGHTAIVRGTIGCIRLGDV